MQIYREVRMTERSLERVTRRFRVTGKVQGVYFRHSTRLEAQRAGVHGVARNLPDGSVEVIAHGEHHAVETLRAWLTHGPAMARVDGVEELESHRRGEAGGESAWHSFSVE
jgi:acylphosphatase